MNRETRKARVRAEAYEQASAAAQSLGIVHGEFKAVIQNGECVSLFPTQSLPRDKVELIDTK